MRGLLNPENEEDLVADQVQRSATDVAPVGSIRRATKPLESVESEMKLKTFESRHTCRHTYPFQSVKIEKSLSTISFKKVRSLLSCNILDLCLH